MPIPHLLTRYFICSILFSLCVCIYPLSLFFFWGIWEQVTDVIPHTLKYFSVWLPKSRTLSYITARSPPNQEMMSLQQDLPIHISHSEFAKGPNNVSSFLVQDQSQSTRSFWLSYVFISFPDESVPPSFPIFLDHDKVQISHCVFPAFLYV